MAVLVGQTLVVVVTVFLSVCTAADCRENTDVHRETSAVVSGQCHQVGNRKVSFSIPKEILNKVINEHRQVFFSVFDPVYS